MFFAFRVRPADPSGNDEGLNEVLALLNAQPLDRLRPGHYIANPRMTEWQLRQLLLKVGDQVEVQPLPGRPTEPARRAKAS
jgi:hypothetical protein